MRTEVTFYMAGGCKVKIKCKSLSITKLTGSLGRREVDFEKPIGTWTIDLDKVEAMTTRKIWF